MNDEDLDRRDDTAARDESDRPAIVAYDPYFPLVHREEQDARAHRFDPHFSSDGCSDFE